MEIILQRDPSRLKSSQEEVLAVGGEQEAGLFGFEEERLWVWEQLERRVPGVAAAGFVDEVVEVGDPQVLHALDGPGAEGVGDADDGDVSARAEARP